jgi:hypothetical protein
LVGKLSLVEAAAGT